MGLARALNSSMRGNVDLIPEETLNVTDGISQIRHRHSDDRAYYDKKVTEGQWLPVLVGSPSATATAAGV